MVLLSYSAPLAENPRERRPAVTLEPPHQLRYPHFYLRDLKHRVGARGPMSLGGGMTREQGGFPSGRQTEASQGHKIVHESLGRGGWCQGSKLVLKVVSLHWLGLLTMHLDLDGPCRAAHTGREGEKAQEWGWCACPVHPSSFRQLLPTIRTQSPLLPWTPCRRSLLLLPRSPRTWFP